MVKGNGRADPLRLERIPAIRGESHEMQVYTRSSKPILMLRHRSRQVIARTGLLRIEPSVRENVAESAR